MNESHLFYCIEDNEYEKSGLFLSFVKSFQTLIYWLKRMNSFLSRYSRNEHNHCLVSFNCLFHPQNREIIVNDIVVLICKHGGFLQDGAKRL